jgi:hypothetical protein
MRLFTAAVVEYDDMCAHRKTKLRCSKGSGVNFIPAASCGVDW